MRTERGSSSFTVVKDGDSDDNGVSVPENALRRNGGSIEDGEGAAAELEHPALPDQEGHQVRGVQLVEPQPPAVQQVSTTTPAVQQVSTTTPAVQQVSTTTPAVQQVSTTTPAVQQVSTTTPAVQQVSTTTPAVQQVSTTTPAVQQVSTTTPAVQQVSTTTPAVQQVSTTTPAVQQVSTTTPAVQQVSTTTPAVQQASTTTPAVQQVSTTTPAVVQVSTTTPAGVTALWVDIVSSPEDGAAYTVGEAIEVAVSFSGPVTVSGQPRLALAIGDAQRWARYTHSGQGGALLYFVYVVTAGDADDDGVGISGGAVDANGGTIVDDSDAPADLTLPRLLPAGHRVSGTLPVSAQRQVAAQQVSTSTSTLKPEITGPEGPVTKHFYVRVQFPTKVGGMALDDAVVTNGRLLLFQSNANPDPLSVDYTYAVMPAGDGAVTFAIRAGAARDANGVESVKSDTFTVQADVTRPKAGIERIGVQRTVSPKPVNEPFDIRVVFSEHVTGLTAGDFAVQNGTVSNVRAETPQDGYALQWTATVTPTATGKVAIYLPAGRVADRVGHPNEASPSFGIDADLTPPSVTIATATTTVKGPFTITITLRRAGARAHSGRDTRDQRPGRQPGRAY